jgi:hypothetical protein
VIHAASSREANAEKKIIQEKRRRLGSGRIEAHSANLNEGED